MQRCFAWLRKVGTVLIVGGVIGASSDAVVAADGIIENIFEMFQARRPAARVAPPADVAVEAAPERIDQFTPHLKKLLATEIYFVKKVCRPDAEQLKRIEAAGEQQIKILAKEYAVAARNNNTSLGNIDPRDRLCGVLEKAVANVMPEDAAKRYSQELAAREKSLEEALAGMTTVVVDRAVLLTPTQFDELRTRFSENWHREWPRDLQIYQYEQYVSVPDTVSLRYVLNDRQLSILSSRPQNGRTIFFGWEHQFGPDWGGEIDWEDEATEENN
jgi:hypothetical protein